MSSYSEVENIILKSLEEAALEGMNAFKQGVYFNRCPYDPILRTLSEKNRLLDLQFQLWMNGWGMELAKTKSIKETHEFITRKAFPNEDSYDNFA